MQWAIPPEDRLRGQVNGSDRGRREFSARNDRVVTGSGVAQPDSMKARKLLSGAALILPLLLLPATASAQRGGWNHGWRHGGVVVAQPVIIVGQPVAVPTVVSPIIVTPPVVVTRPVFGNVVPVGPFDRVGFGTIPVRTGFETAPVGFGVHHGVVPVPVFVGGHHRRFGSAGVRSFGPRHGGGVVVVRRHR